MNDEFEYRIYRYVQNQHDAGKVVTLVRQIYPGKSKFVVVAYKDATKEPYGYLLIVLRPETDDNYRIRIKKSR